MPSNNAITINNDTYTLTGTVWDTTRNGGAPQIEVKVYDKDLISADDYLGTTQTNEQGEFSIQFKRSDFQEWIFDRRPDLYFVGTLGGEVLFNTEAFPIRNVDESTEAIRLEVSLAPVETSVADAMSSNPQAAGDCLPTVEIPANKELKAISDQIAYLRDYESKNWGIGLNGGNFRPDGFLGFFTQRGLAIDYYDVNFGVSIGSTAAYGSNIDQLEARKAAIIAQETPLVEATIAQLETYKKNFWAIGLNGDTLLPDGFNVFFAEREIPFHPFVRSTTGVKIGEQSAYDVNIQTLRDYLTQIN